MPAFLTRLDFSIIKVNWTESASISLWRNTDGPLLLWQWDLWKPIFTACIPLAENPGKKILQKFIIMLLLCGLVHNCLKENSWHILLHIYYYFFFFFSVEMIKFCSETDKRFLTDIPQIKIISWGKYHCPFFPLVLNFTFVENSDWRSLQMFLAIFLHLQWDPQQYDRKWENEKKTSICIQCSLLQVSRSFGAVSGTLYRIQIRQLRLLTAWLSKRCQWTISKL